MKTRLIALAALAAVGSAHALTPAQIDAARTAGTLKEVYMAGGSAQRLFVGAWFQAQCNPSSFDVFFNGTGAAPSGSNHRAYSCNLKKKVGNWVVGTPVLFVKRDAGGSFQGVNPIATATAQDLMAVNGTCTATGNASPATDILVPSFACNNTVSRLADAGVSDVEPALFQKQVNLPAPQVKVDTTTLDSKAFNQTIMGVVVNKKLYRALQEAQGLIAAGGVIDEAPNKMPTLSRTFVAAAMSGQLTGSTADKRGWNIVVPASVDAAVLGKQVNVCRRNIGSGTQASFNVELLNAGCGAGTSTYVPVGQTVGTDNSSVVASPALAETGTLAWNLGSGSGAVETCLGTTVEALPGTAYAIGMLSRENTPTPTGTSTDKGYRFVKLDGVSPTRDAAKIGNYKFVYNATMQWSKTTLTDADVKSFLTALRANGGKAAQLNVADVDTQQGVLAAPASYTGAYEDQTDPVTLKFASRMDRNVAASCSPMRLVK
ncbi:MAG TPA: hypothetical protein VLA61_04265 [Ideonella sp.]|uniref:hypothetical protein n=1 Tax=Ideonella sp. TaxID=1929293 RepID=UPI002C5C32EF|nr:hypothetical protein [Ideonella sp.]HSI47454.1 hypothetical protein [Ideonella sp.]